MSEFWNGIGLGAVAMLVVLYVIGRVRAGKGSATTPIPPATGQNSRVPTRETVVTKKGT
jgi:hypothetical protein